MRGSVGVTLIVLAFVVGTVVLITTEKKRRAAELESVTEPTAAATTWRRASIGLASGSRTPDVWSLAVPNGHVYWLDTGYGGAAVFVPSSGESEPPSPR